MVDVISTLCNLKTPEVLLVAVGQFRPNHRLLDTINRCAFLFTEAVLLYGREVSEDLKRCRRISCINKTQESHTAVQQGKEEFIWD